MDLTRQCLHAIERIEPVTSLVQDIGERSDAFRAQAFPVAMAAPEQGQQAAQMLGTVLAKDLAQGGRSMCLARTAPATCREHLDAIGS